MKRIVMLLLVASLVPGPVLAATAAQETGPTQETVATETAVPAAPATNEPADGDLLETIAVTAREIAAEDVAAVGVEHRSTVQDDGGVATWKMIVGVGLLAGGAGLIGNGIALRQEEPDPFGRVKDADSWVAIGVGASFMTIGAFVVRDALGGNEF